MDTVRRNALATNTFSDVLFFPMLVFRAVILILLMGRGVSAAEEIVFETADWGLITNATPYVFGVHGNFTVAEKLGGKILWQGRTPKGASFDDVQVSKSGEICGFFADNSSDRCADLEILARGGRRYVLGSYGLSAAAKEPLPEKFPFPFPHRGIIPRAILTQPRFKDSGVRHFFSLTEESSVAVWSSWTGTWLRWNWLSDEVSVISEQDFLPALIDSMRSTVMQSLRLNFPYVPLEDRNARDIVRRSNSASFLILYYLWGRNQAGECEAELNNNSFQAKATRICPITVTLSNEKLAFLTHIQRSDRKALMPPRTAQDLEEIRLGQKQALIKIPLPNELWGVPLGFRGVIRQKKSAQSGSEREWNLAAPQFPWERGHIRMVRPAAPELTVEIIDLPVGLYDFRCEVLAGAKSVSRFSTNLTISIDTKTVGEAFTEPPF